MWGNNHCNSGCARNFRVLGKQRWVPWAFGLYLGLTHASQALPSMVPVHHCPWALSSLLCPLGEMRLSSFESFVTPCDCDLLWLCPGSWVWLSHMLLPRYPTCLPQSSCLVLLSIWVQIPATPNPWLLHFKSRGPCKHFCSCPFVLLTELWKGHNDFDRCGASTSTGLPGKGFICL